MNSPKPISATLFFLLIIFFKLSYCIGKNSISFCPEIEKQSLISFKQFLKDPSNKLSSWNINAEVNCCKWKGVFCNNYTGHVHQLRLQNYTLSGKLNPSLLNLKHLGYLDLGQNYFDQTIPSIVGSFTTLEYLNLSDAGFYGIIPHVIGNLSNLHTLSLESTKRSLDVDNLQWLSGLSRLQRLNMNYVNLSRAATNWIQVINTLSSLVELRFCSCNINFIAPLNGVVNISSLSILDLSSNDFQSFVIPKWIFQLNEITFLNLSSNNFEGPIPSISNTTKLQHIDLSNNLLNSTIPDWLYFCKDLQFVSLSANYLHNTISNAVANLSSLNTLNLSWNELSGKIPREFVYLCKMIDLGLSVNMFEGDISDSFGNMSDCFLGNLESLGVGWNQLSGHIPDQFGEFKNLKALHLGVNKLTGNLPQSLGKLHNLKTLSSGVNMLEGEVTENHFANLTKLTHLHLAENPLTLKVNPNWIPPFKLRALALSSWNLGGLGPQIPSWLPSWLDTKENIDILDLSNTGISGNVPSWFWEIRELNISHNCFHGTIPDISGHIEDVHRLMYLSSNQFNGSLPRVANSVTELDLSNNSFSGDMSHFLCDVTNETYRLEILHLGNNKLTGELPDCFMKWPSLKVLNLGNNNFYGSIPNSIGFLVNLQSLNLRGNHFSGQVPFPLHSCSKLLKIDLSRNQFDGNMPTWIGTSLTNLKFLILRSNKFGGEISSYICHLTSLQILDLSDNEFSGVIPRCVDNFTAMATRRSLQSYDLFYSYYFQTFIEDAIVSTKGSEYQYDAILELVTNINLSKNNFSGEIPEEFTSLVELL